METTETHIYDERREAVIVGLKSLRERATDTRDQQIIDAQIDQEFLKEIGKWSSEPGFSSKGPLPLFLFNNVQPTEELLSPQTLTISNSNKAIYTSPELEGRAINDKSWFSETVGGHLAVRVLSDVLRKVTFNVATTPTPDLYWSKLKEFIATAQEGEQTPILFVSRLGEPEWLSDWLHTMRFLEGTPRPDDMQVWKKDDMPTEYWGNLNEIEVYRASIPEGASFLLMREAFDMVKFHKFEDERFVNVTTAPVEGNPLLVDLRLTWQMEVIVKPLPALELRHTSA